MNITDPAYIRSERAANETLIRAQALGYSRTAQQQFARLARREASEWECPQHTALRIVIPMRTKFGAASQARRQLGGEA